METNELIAILRYCASNGCIRDGVDEPCKFGIENETSDCVSPLLTEAADRMEEQDRIIQRYKRADIFLSTHGWEWRDDD